MVADHEPTVRPGDHLLLPLVEDEEGLAVHRCDGGVDAVEEAVEARLLIAAALDLTDQDPTINQMMASMVLQVVRRMVAGRCSFKGLYLDIGQGTVLPTYATPEAVERVVKPESDPRTGRAHAWSGGQRPSGQRTQTQAEKKQGEEKPCLTRKETP